MYNVVAKLDAGSAKPATKHAVRPSNLKQNHARPTHVEEPALARLVRIQIVVVLLALGCATDSEVVPGHVVRDSAGIRIVENVHGAWSTGEAWQVMETPRLRIGIAEGDPERQLWGVVGARRLVDGRIVIANGGTHELRFYDEQGTFLSAVGREGEGPGEFRAMSRLDVMSADTLVVFDGTLRRMSVFAPNGEFVRSFPLPAIDERVFPRPRGGLFADGSVLAYTERGVEGAPGSGAVIREPGLFFRLDPHTGTAEVIGEFPIRGFYFHPRAGNVLIPFEPHPWPIAAGDVFHYGKAVAPEIGVYTMAGELRRIIRWRQESTPVDPADVESFLEQQLARIESEQARAAMSVELREAYALMPVHRSRPAYSDLRVDADGQLWVAQYEPPGREPQRWLIFDSEGRFLGPVDSPAGVTIYQIGRGFLLGRSVDELGVERVDLYDLIR
jgi:hypothetical protein